MPLKPMTQCTQEPTTYTHIWHSSTLNILYHWLLIYTNYIVWPVCSPSHCTREASSLPGSIGGHFLCTSTFGDHQEVSRAFWTTCKLCLPCRVSPIPSSPCSHDGSEHAPLMLCISTLGGPQQVLNLTHMPHGLHGHHEVMPPAVAPVINPHLFYFTSMCLITDISSRLPHISTLNLNL